MKKDITDGLLQLAIVLSLFRTDLNNYLNSYYNNYPEIHEIILGTTSAYTQTNFHTSSWHNDIGYSHPKNIDNYYASSVFRELHSLSQYRRFDGVNTNINAWLVSGQATVLPSESASESAGSGQTVQNAEDSGVSEGTNDNADVNVQEADVGAIDVGAVAPEEVESLSKEHLGDELTKEDMDLIDILWRQDMDLGVGREMFDQNRRKELEKERELELLKKEKEQELKAKEVKEQSEPPQEQQQINYIVDGETGELVPAPPGSSEVTTQQPVLVVDLPPTLEENESVSIEEAMRILEEETGPLCNNSLSISSNNNNDTNLPNINLNVGQLEQEIQAMIQNAEAFNHTQPQVAYERQDSFERSWQDVANMLNLASDNGTMTPGLNMSTSPAMPNVSQALLNNATLAPQTQNNNNNMNFTENTDAGFAPVQNNSLPYTNTSLPSTDATQGLFCLDTNDLLFPNVTCTGEQNDSFSQTQTLLQQLMSEDDLEPMDFTNVTVSQGLQSVRLMDDASSDSAVSSMGSSASPVQEMSDTHSNFSEVSSPFDGLEGATGGSNLSDGSGSKYPQRKDKFSFARYGSYGGSDMNTNSSGSSNDSSGSFHPADMRHVNHNHSYPLQPGQQSREAKRRAEEERKERLAHSRDEKRAKSLKIPFSTDDIIDSPVERFNEMMQKYKLTEPQLQLIRDIRRRGKNKVAAQNCRKRKLEVIGTLEDEVIAMRAEKERLRKERLMIDKEAAEVKERLNQLYQEVFHSLRDDSGHPYDPNEYTLQHTSDGNVFLVPRNETSSQPHKEKGQKKRKGSKKNH